MSSRFKFVDAGSTFGQMQRVAASGQYNRIQTAYRAYIDHGSRCPTCAVDSALCSTAEALWETYQAANSS
jgi:hypothetical protein